MLLWHGEHRDSTGGEVDLSSQAEGHRSQCRLGESEDQEEHGCDAETRDDTVEDRDSGGGPMSVVGEHREDHAEHRKGESSRAKWGPMTGASAVMAKTTAIVPASAGARDRWWLPCSPRRATRVALPREETMGQREGHLGGRCRQYLDGGAGGELGAVFGGEEVGDRPGGQR